MQWKVLDFLRIVLISFLMCTLPQLGFFRFLSAQASCQNVEIRPNGRNLSFAPGVSWESCGYRLVFQRDGNLALYNPSGTAIWATGTERFRADQLLIQADGNVVVVANGKAVWASNTDGNPGAFLAVQGDGNLVVYDKTGRIALFNTNTHAGRTSSRNASSDWAGESTGSNSTIAQKQDEFFRWAVGKKNITRLDILRYKGECVTLIARYMQEVFQNDPTKNLAFGHGRDTARRVSELFSQHFSPVTSSGVPKRGAVISFPNVPGQIPLPECGSMKCGHTAIVLEASEEKARILESNWGKGESVVRENWISLPYDNNRGSGVYWTNPK